MKKIVIGGAVGAVLFVAAVWVGFDLFLVEKVDPVSPTSGSVTPSLPAFAAYDPASVPPGVPVFLNELAAEVRAGESTKAVSRFDTTRLYALAAAFDRTPDPALPKLIGAQLPQLYSTAVEAFGRDGFGLPWDRLDVLNATNANGVLIVHVRHVSRDHVVPVRWWLAETAKGFVAVDLEDLRFGLRFTHQFAMMLGTGLPTERVGPASDAAKAIRDASAFLANGQPAPADAALGPAKRTPLPPVQNKAALALEGLAASALGHAEKAETIAAAIGDLPAAKLIRTASAKHVEAARSYEATFGPTPLTISVRLRSLVGEGKVDEAVGLLQIGLIEFPDSPTLQMWVALLL